LIQEEETFFQASYHEHPVQYWEQGNNDLKDKLDCIVEECAIALVYNGISHAVMMATPANLEEFALGFSLTEGIITNVSQVYDINLSSCDKGIEVNIEISSQQMSGLKSHRRNLIGRTGCGLCGSESLDKAIKPIKATSPQSLPTTEAIQRAVNQLSEHQQLNSLTGAVHGVAWCDKKGDIKLLREDVGRHNALDKLIGALSLDKVILKEGFALTSSRASYEMVQKVSSVNISTLVAVSAPTALAINLATKAKINLIGFARPGRYVVYNKAIT
jgi:FdhD protein